jgi:drug/metabolite transporter, DME family
LTIQQFVSERALKMSVSPKTHETQGEVAFLRDQWVGRFQIALAGLLWSTSGFFAKAPWFDAWPQDSRGLLLAFFRALFAIPVLLPLIRRPYWDWRMLPMMVAFAVMVWSFMTAVVLGPAANAIWLQYLCPVWVLLVSVIVFREKVSAPDIRMFLFCISGVGLILACEMIDGSGLWATLLGILSGVSFAAVVMLMRSLRGSDPTWLIALNHSATVILLAPWVWGEHRPIGVGGYFALALFGVFQMSAAYILFARGLRSTSGPEASVLSLIEPILVPVWVYVAWHHHSSYLQPPWWTWVGAVLITLGLVSRYLPAIIVAANQNRPRV